MKCCNKNLLLKNCTPECFFWRCHARPETRIYTCSISGVLVQPWFVRAAVSLVLHKQFSRSASQPILHTSDTNQPLGIIRGMKVCTAERLKVLHSKPCRDLPAQPIKFVCVCVWRGWQDNEDCWTTCHILLKLWLALALKPAVVAEELKS